MSIAMYQMNVAVCFLYVACCLVLLSIFPYNNCRWCVRIEVLHLPPDPWRPHLCGESHWGSHPDLSTLRTILPCKSNTLWWIIENTSTCTINMIKPYIRKWKVWLVLLVVTLKWNSITEDVLLLCYSQHASIILILQAMKEVWFGLSIIWK